MMRVFNKTVGPSKSLKPLVRPPGFLPKSVELEGGFMFGTMYPERFGIMENVESSSPNDMSGSECNRGPAPGVDSEGSQFPYTSCAPISRIEQLGGSGVSSDQAIISSSSCFYHSPVSSATAIYNPLKNERGTMSETPLLETSCDQSSFDATEGRIEAGSVHLVSPSNRSPFGKGYPPPFCQQNESEFVNEYRRNFSELALVSNAVGYVESQVTKLADQDHGIHIWTERERRKKMRGMFVTLHSMLPDSSPKADKSMIVDEAICYIKQLEQKLQKLLRTKAARTKIASSKIQNSSLLISASLPLKKKAESSEMDPLHSRLPSLVTAESCAFQTWCSPNVVLNVCGTDVFINICATLREGLLSKILSCVIGFQDLEIVNVQISSAVNCKRLFMIHTRASEESESGDKSLNMMIEDLVSVLCNGHAAPAT